MHPAALRISSLRGAAAGLGAAALLTAAARLHALTIDNYTSAANDRFANNPAFIAKTFNLSGISRASNGAWVTMIAPNVFVATNHHTPA